jgi:hypothetical protein
MQKFEFILDYLNQQGGAVKEHELLSYIEQEHPEFFAPLLIADQKSPSLFKKHFYLFHQLHHLNNALLPINQCLIISALEIRICLIKDAGNQVGHNDGLKSFYLDEANLHLSDQEISQMLQAFWQKYMAVEQKAEAIEILGLQGESDLTISSLKKRYNQLAKLHHPDKGGNDAEFVKIKQAYQSLKCLFK